MTGENDFVGYAYNEKHAEGVWTGDRLAIRRSLERCRLAVVTVGLAERWEDSQTGGVFWMGVPEAVFDPGRHRLRVATPAEITADLAEIARLLPCPACFVLCPVPLNATFTARPAITANA
eukprot:scaffold18020_cov49-Prasinocladus_malaysianus.AAC.2